MPGMGHNAISLTNPLIVSLFHHRLYVASVYWIIAIGLALLLVATLSHRAGTFNLSKAGLSESRARTYLRLGFGVIWLFDGILQFQASCRSDSRVPSCARLSRAHRDGYAQPSFRVSISGTAIPLP